VGPAIGTGDVLLGGEGGGRKTEDLIGGEATEGVI